MMHNRTRVYGPAARTKLDLMGIRFADAGGDGSGAGGDGDGSGGKPTGQEPPTFTQAQLEAIVAQRLEQQAKNKFGDYDELKAKAAGAKTLEERVGTLESELSTSRAEGLRTRIAAEYGISTKKGDKGEPSDADLFLTGSDEATLTAQATRLAAQVAERNKNGNVAPKEGDTKNEGKDDQDMRAFTRNLFGQAD